MTSEAEYARLVALGALRPAIRALIDARDLMYAIESPISERLRVAAKEAALAEQELMALGHPENQADD